MIKPYKFDLCIFKGSDFDKGFQLRGTTGPVDLTGATIRSMCRKTESSTIYISLGAHIIDPVEGLWGLKLTAAETSLVAFSHGVYDVEVEFANGVVNQVLRGNVLFKAEVTYG